ncbi:MAG: ABC transporter substrate-binding protein [Alphaproteobacteria bacterium]|nr:ABC transporter substrate-binding protein [Alphaproteobacteria bacterium]
MLKIIGMVAFAFLVSTFGLPASAQPNQKIYRIGTLLPGAADTDQFMTWFRAGMQDLGYGEGRDYVLISRWTRDNRKRVPALAKELVGQKVDVILTRGSLQTKALQKATKSIPIVVGSSGALRRFVKSLAQPGGNITGLTYNSRAIHTKRLSLLKAALPGARRVAFLSFSAGNLAGRLKRDLKRLKAAGLAQGIDILPYSATTLGAAEKVFRSMAGGMADAVIINNEQFSHFNQRSLASLAVANKVPTVCDPVSFAREGCLISYAPDRTAMARRAAAYVHKILKGATPANLPVEISTKYHLVVNSKTAKTIGVTLPAAILLLADEVIQ